MAKAVKLSISLSPELAEKLREQAGPGSVSAFVEEALASQLRNVVLGEILAEQQARVGPAPKELVEATKARMRRLEALPDPDDSANP